MNLKLMAVVALFLACGGAPVGPTAGEPCTKRGAYVVGTCMVCSCTVDNGCAWKEYASAACAKAEQACSENPDACEQP